MTEPREPQAEAAADLGLEVSPEMIQDLDVTDDDADNVAGSPDVQPKETYGKPVHKVWAGNRPPSDAPPPPP